MSQFYLIMNFRFSISYFNPILFYHKGFGTVFKYINSGGQMKNQTQGVDLGE